MKIKTSPDQSPSQRDLLHFELAPDFLMNFRTRSTKPPSTKTPRVCPGFSTSHLPAGRGESPFEVCFERRASLREKNRGSREPFACQKKEKKVRNPFHSSEDSAEADETSLRGFLQDLDVSRISEDFQSRTVRPFKSPAPEAFRSMDFENLSFEHKSPSRPASPKGLSDLRSENSPIQTCRANIQRELQMLLQRKPLLPQPPAYSKRGSKTLKGARSVSLNPFADCEWEGGWKNRGQGSLKWAGAGSKGNASEVHYCMRTRPNPKNCFYETDEETEKDTVTRASKLTTSPRANKGSSLWSQRNAPLNHSGADIFTQMNLFFEKNESFLTQNKSEMSLPRLLRASPNKTIPLYRADQTEPFNEHRSQSQRSLFSVKIERRTPSIFGHAKAFRPPLTKNKSCFFSTKRRALLPFFPQSTKSSNFLCPLQPERGPSREARPFSPSQHSHRRTRFWPSHLEDRLSNLDSSFCSNVEPFLSLLSPNAKAKSRRGKDAKSLLAAKILELNKKISKKVLSRKGKFDRREGSELVQLFSELVRTGPERGAVGRQVDLKKVKRC